MIDGEAGVGVDVPHHPPNALRTQLRLGEESGVHDDAPTEHAMPQGWWKLRARTHRISLPDSPATPA
jgi:hypothetical protein